MSFELITSLGTSLYLKRAALHLSCERAQEQVHTIMQKEGGKGGIVIPFHAQNLTKFTRHVLNQSLSEKPQENEIFTTKHK